MVEAGRALTSGVMDAPKRTIATARGLRRTMSPPELRLWAILRRREVDGLRFRRQHPIGPFILDFYCDHLKLAVEVDGEQHGLGDHPARDARRDLWLQRRGIETVRFAAIDVRDNLEGVVTEIRIAAEERRRRP